MRIKLLFIALCFTTSIALGQDYHRCSFLEANGWHTHEGKRRFAAFEKVLQEKIAERRAKGLNQRTTGTIYKIPTIVHVIHNGEAIGEGPNIAAEQVYSQIEVLNEDFRKLNADFNSTRAMFRDVAGDAEIEFVLATEDPDGNLLPEPGIHRYNGGKNSWAFGGGSGDAETVLKPQTSWDPSKYANMWTVNFTEGQLLGYAQFPQQVVNGLNFPGYSNADETDGVVMGYRFFGSRDKYPDGNYGSSQYDLGRTTTHEVGHWLGLRHIWGDGGCGIDDFVDDTPAQGTNYANGSGIPSCAPDTSNTCGSLDMWENFMDYSDDRCLTMFSQGQVERMRTVMENDTRRLALTTSPVGVSDIPTEPFNAPVYSFTTTACGITFKSDAYVALSTETASGISWTFENGSISSSTDQMVSVDFPPGTHEVTLSMTSSLGTTTATFNVTIGSGTTTTLPLATDFSSGIPTEWAQPSNSWLAVSTATSNGDAIGIDNFANDYSGDPQNLQAQVFSLDGVTHLQISFDVAYAYYQDGNAVDYDSLGLWLYDGCNESFLFWQKGGDELSTTSPSATSYFPATDNEWRTETILVAIPEGWNNAAVIFSNIGYFGNNLFIDNVSIEAADLPLTLNITGDELICDESSTTLTSSITDADSYEWTKLGSSTVIGTNASLEISESGNYQLFITKGVDRGLATKEVTFAETPTAAFSYKADETTLIVTFNNESTGATSYQWDFDDGQTSTSIHPTHLYADFGDYTVTLTATSICGSNNTSQLLSEITALEDNAISQQIKLFPNPNRGEFVLDLSQSLSFQRATIQLVDITGRVVWEQQADYFAQKTIKLQNPTKGIYFVKLNLDGQLAVKRLLVE
ncbi:MAG: PKD domain-containing protein [Flammeovirgaceae bacterium]